MNNRLWRLYVLKLEQDKWYVGITTQPVKKRFLQHQRGFGGARWTKKYKPLRIHDVKDLGVCDIERAQLFEGRVTRKYMEKYGDNNVRGGDLTDIDDYVRRFGYIYTVDSWRTIKDLHILFAGILILAAYFLIDKYIVGGCG